ncbi:MAG: hypothetical protein OXO56_06710 [Gammaproteobacteria bacterium]|nr:hypothetical protein [Gammaproteobacteria bacterium]
MIGEPDSWAPEWIAEWSARGGAPHVHPVPWEAFEAGDFTGLEEWPGVADLAAIDLFVGEDPDDPTGEGAVWRLVAFLQALAPFRLEAATRDCRLNIVTRGAVCGVEAPRGNALWGAVRSLALELLAEDTKIDFRLVDLGTADDVEVLARLDAV